MTTTEKSIGVRRHSLPAPGLGEHAVVTGQNGSGKTETACQILSAGVGNTYQAIIIDTKGEERFESLPGEPAIHTKPRGIRADGEHQFIVYRPGLEDNSPAQIDTLLLEVFNQRRNVYLYIDEMYQVCPNAKPTPGYGYCLMQGRRRWDGKTASRMCIFSGSQRPVWIPRHGFTEAKHFYIHSLSEGDMDVMCGYVGRKSDIMMEAPPEGHEFYYYENTAQSRDGKRYPPQKFEFDLERKQEAKVA